MKLSIIVPTVGRSTLARTLQSLSNQPLHADDEVIVCGGPACRMTTTQAFGARFIATRPGNDWGCKERTLAIANATGTHLAFIDDDDWWLPGARAAIADAMQQTPTQPVLFRMQYLTGTTLWLDAQVRCGNVSTQMMLLPNDPARLGKWTRRREGDYDFLASMTWPQTDIVWRTEVIAQIGKDR
jgi:glycosyltransferase involved in cell wall biosynthesis